MQQASSDAVAAAARRLSGHLVRTPLIGTPFGLADALGLPVEPDVRSKPERLQCGADAWFRGYLHFLLRSLGAHAGLVADVGGSRAAAAAIAAALHRVPFVLVAAVEPAAELGAVLRAAGAEVRLDGDPEIAARALAQRRGFRRLPDQGDADVALGLATIGLELAEQLPRSTAAVVAPEELAAAIEQGLRAGGCTAAVVPVCAPAAGNGDDAGARGAAVWRRAHGLDLGPASRAVFAAAVARGGGEPVAAVLAD